MRRVQRRVESESERVSRKEEEGRWRGKTAGKKKARGKDARLGCRSVFIICVLNKMSIIQNLYLCIKIYKTYCIPLQCTYWFIGRLYTVDIEHEWNRKM